MGGVQGKQKEKSYFEGVRPKRKEGLILGAGPGRFHFNYVL